MSEEIIVRHQPSILISEGKRLKLHYEAHASESRARSFSSGITSGKKPMSWSMQLPTKSMSWHFHGLIYF